MPIVEDIEKISPKTPYPSIKRERTKSKTTKVIKSKSKFNRNKVSQKLRILDLNRNSIINSPTNIINNNTENYIENEFENNNNNININNENNNNDKINNYDLKNVIISNSFRDNNVIKNNVNNILFFNTEDKKEKNNEKKDLN